ncbi:ATP-dependent Clp protease proteolytic subunit [Candidatus Pacearchaeota archaeon]|nr:ATP-dependent Clp protease proteolytic subunit [Candidatus Pacearchaeota archaeon]
MPKIALKNLTIDDEYFYLSNLHEFGIGPLTREIYLTGEEALSDSDTLVEPGVEYTMVTRFIKNLRYLEHRSHQPILIHMKTCGGLVEEGFAVYDAIRFSPCQITILSYTHARSMSSIILQAADKRVMMPNSYFMIHWGTAEYRGGHSQVQSWAEFDKKMESRFIGVYIDRMEQEGSRFDQWDRPRIERVLRTRMGAKTDVILTPAEAIEWNLADKIFDGDWKGLI